MLKNNICRIIMVAYHLLFLGGTRFYIVEFQKTRDVIIQQRVLIEDRLKKLQNSADDLLETRQSLVSAGQNLSKDVDKLINELIIVKRTCSKL